MERGIIFSGPMVRVIPNGKKTQTRRVIKVQPTGADYWTVHTDTMAFFPNTREANPKLLVCPYGRPGDKLWVRETWAALHGDPEDFHGSHDIPLSSGDGYWKVAYKADGTWPEKRMDRGFDWRPSIYMPRWASRITIEITDVRVQRLREIDEDDAQAEGVECDLGEPEYQYGSGYGDVYTIYPDGTFVAPYRRLWDIINAKYSWESNPWVFALTFRVM
jgi:hypothetical protein